ncbi:hypothetical protein NFC79_21255 (plasmid) [Providencia stuartii]|nr:hypothetical protein NFC79_21255 [Providencia stuartii]
MIKKISAFLVLFVSFFSFAEVSVIGIMINKAMKEDVERNYHIESKNGDLWELSRNEIQIEGVKKVEVIFESDYVKAVWLTVDKGKFDYFFEALKGKYSLIKKDIPFVGNKYATFEKNGIAMWINAPHMSFEMDVVYMDKKYKNKREEIIKESKENKKTKELEQL